MDRDQLENYKKELGSRLRKARKEAELTQQQAADKLSIYFADAINASRIGNYEQGTRTPDPLVVQALCEIYCAKPSWIYGFSDSPISQDEEDLLAKYRQTDDRGRRAISGCAEDQPIYTIKNRRETPIFEWPVDS